MAQSNQGQAPSSRAPSPPPAQGSTPGGPDAPTPVAENWCYTQVKTYFHKPTLATLV